jgi:hypothetical protein
VITAWTNDGIKHEITVFDGDFVSWYNGDVASFESLVIKR